MDHVCAAEVTHNTNIDCRISAYRGGRPPTSCCFIASHKMELNRDIGVSDRDISNEPANMNLQKITV